MIRIGIVGAGGNTISAHLPKLINQNGVEVVSVANRTIASGEKVAKKCTACHVFVDGGNNKVGPGLYNIVNKPIGKADYGYSKAFAALNGNWTYEELNKFLYKPKEYVKGTKMNFAGLKKTKDRANLIAWLRERSNAPAPLPNK